MPDDSKDPNEATETADLYHRHEQRTENWEEADAVTGREPDVAPANSTLGERAKARQSQGKQVQKAASEDKAVSRATKKAAPKK